MKYRLYALGFLDQLIYIWFTVAGLLNVIVTNTSLIEGYEYQDN